ncbi:MAG: hypothetical protein WBM86_23525, partial [Waterburya sp.]
QMYQIMCESFNIDNIEAKDLLDKAELAGKHDEFYKVSEELALDKSVVSFTLIKGALQSSPNEKTRINDFINNQIKSLNI